MVKSILVCFLLPLLAAAQEATSLPQPGYNGGEDNPQDPSDAGAAGASKGAFTLSKGALAAIIVVAVLVAVVGIGSAVLYWLAKKRQWDVRQSIRRASRRLTGRSDAPNKRQNRRTGVRLNSPPPGRNTKPSNPQDRDVEKGVLPATTKEPKSKPAISTFDVDTPDAKSAKPSFFGAKK